MVFGVIAKGKDRHLEGSKLSHERKGTHRLVPAWFALSFGALLPSPLDLPVTVIVVRRLKNTNTQGTSLEPRRTIVQSQGLLTCNGCARRNGLCDGGSRAEHSSNLCSDVIK